MNNNTKNFLLYGTTQRIARKQILEVDGLFCFFAFLSIFLGYVNLVWCIVNLCLPIFVSALTWSATTIEGIKVLWILGVWGAGLCVLLGLLGTALSMMVLEKNRLYFLCGILVMYIVIFLIYVGIIISLIKINAYKKLKKVNKRIALIFIGVCGISIARVASKKISYEEMVQIGSVCCYLASFLSMMGVINLIKYYVLKRNPEYMKETNNRDCQT